MPHISVCERNIFAESDAELLHRKICFGSLSEIKREKLEIAKSRDFFLLV